MKSRTALHTAAGESVIIDEVDVPDPQPHQVIVKMLATGVCHSQLHQMADPDRPRPMVLGHEATGVVTQTGHDVTHVGEGDHVIVTWVPRTPIRGRPNREPPGATYQGELVHDLLVYTWAEDALVNGEYVVRISKEEPTDVTSIVGCAVLTGAGAVMNTARVRPGDSVAIFGAGGVGLSAIGAASILEAYPLIVVDLRDDKLEFAKEFGATHVVNASEVDSVEAVIEISGGGVDYAFDAIGVRATAEQILPVTREGGPGADNHGGMSVLIGWPPKEITLDPTNFLFTQRRYRGSLGATYPERDFATFLRWHREGKFPLDKLVSRRYRFEQVNEACAALEAGEILGRAIIEY